MEYNKLIKLLDKLNMLKGNKLIPFSKFKEYCTIHTYGGSKNKHKVVYMGKPKENLFAFYLFINNDLDMLKDAYAILKKVVAGNMDEYDVNMGWTDRGIPISFKVLK